MHAEQLFSGDSFLKESVAWSLIWVESPKLLAASFGQRIIDLQ